VRTIVTVEEEGLDINEKFTEEREVLAIKLRCDQNERCGSGGYQHTLSFAPSTSHIVCAPRW
jgi:hypothetical protein